MLEVKNLSCGYDTKFILKDVSFNLKGGEILGIIGPNGSGKTTLLRAITKIINPKTGQIFLGNREISGLNFRELAKDISVVSQAFLSDDNLKVEDYVLLGRIPHRHKYQFLETKHDMIIARESMSLTETLQFKNRFISELSGGEKQLVFISRALAQEPKLLLLDEPNTYLDISHQIKILDLIRRLNREKNIGVIIILHDLNLASEYCHRLLLLNNGRLHKIGLPSEVLTYQTIEEVYKTTVIVKENPVSGKPYVFLVSQQTKEIKK